MIDLLSEVLLNTIKEIQAEKKEKNITPNHALHAEISNRIHTEVKQALNKLCKEKKIRFCKTLNDLAFYEEDGQKDSRS